jgi:hypothetical protein
LTNSYVTIGNVLFVGGTLWPKVDDLSSDQKCQFKKCTKDFERIKNLGIRGMAREHRACLDAIKEACQVAQAKNKVVASRAHSTTNRAHDLKVVVVSHFAPSFKSIHPKYGDVGILKNRYYANDLDDFIDNVVPFNTIWVHGHTHTSFDYNLEFKSKRVRVICNPRGYDDYPNQHEENENFVNPLVLNL